MKKKLRGVALILLVVILLCDATIMNATQMVNTETGEGIITQYVEYLGQNNFEELSKILCKEEQLEFNEFISDTDNSTNKIGYYNYKSVELISAVEVNLDSELFGFDGTDHPSVASMSVWETIVSVEAHQETKYLVNGYNKFYFIIGEDEQLGYVVVGSVRDRAWSEIYCEDYVPSFGVAPAGGYDQICYSCENEVGGWTNPTEITVKLTEADGGGTLTLPFNEYCYVVTTYEFGSVSYNEEARKACAMAIKNVAWQRLRYQRYAGKGYDITNNEQVFGLSKTPNEKVIAAVDYIMDYIMLSCDYKLFFAYFQTRFLDNSESIAYYAKYHGGALSHIEANELGKEGMTWIEILHYFYDYGEINTKMTSGEIRVVPLNHTLTAGQYSWNETYHWAVCTTCGCGHIKTPHYYTYFYNNYYRCNTCGNVKMMSN